ncbi:hypothetical protein PSPO01_02564 [Paraphaeosphaeria sporulosa]
MFTLKQRKSKSTTTPPRPRAWNVATTILIYITIWILAPMLVGFLALLAILHIFNDGPSKPRMGVKVAHFDWMQKDWTGNITGRGHTVIS